MSLFERVRYPFQGNTEEFLMHDLVNDLAQIASSKLCVRLEEGQGSHMLEQSWHMSYSMGEGGDFKKLTPPKKFEQLRTLLRINIQGLYELNLSKRVLHNILPKLTSLRALSMKDSETIEEFSNKLMKVVNQIRLMGEELTNSRIVEKVLVSLPERFEVKISSLEDSKDLTKLSPSELVHALHSKFKGKMQMQKEEDDRWFKGKKPPLRCRYCNKLGHIERLCRVKKENNQQTQKANVSKVKEQKEFVFMPMAAIRLNDENTWFLDSGCTQHMTSKQEYFTKLESAKGSVKLADKTKLEIVGKENVAIEAPKGGSFTVTRDVNIEQLDKGTKEFVASTIAACGEVRKSTSKKSNVPHDEQLTAIEVGRRIKLRQENSELQKLHKQLVIGGILSEAKFWAARKRLLEKTENKKPKQRVALKNDMWSVKPLSNGRTNKVTFKLTPEVIHQIFAEKPAVRQAYLNFVPGKMSGKEF
ncbi:Ubiquitin-specific protease 12 isoform 1 [Capsicum annuum]|nr:Ubiquitin-specific protease 12 isoform 1 [Capsicum annuum]